MTRYFCGMWEYRTQIMNYIHTESFLANLIVKRKRLYLVVCDKNGGAVAGMQLDTSDVYRFCGRCCVAGLVLYDTHYCVKIDSLKNVSLVPIY